MEIPLLWQNIVEEETFHIDKKLFTFKPNWGREGHVEVGMILSETWYPKAVHIKTEG